MTWRRCSAQPEHHLRAIDGLLPERYVNFVRSFISPEAGDRFVGGPFDSPEGQPDIMSPMLDLANVRYLLASSSVGLRAQFPQKLIDA